MMTHNEKDALLRYLDFQFINYVENYSKHVSEEVLQSMYENAYGLLTDINRTLDTDIALSTKPVNDKNS